jgi:Gram-negative bacterial TonB protein C-terminal
VNYVTSAQHRMGNNGYPGWASRPPVAVRAAFNAARKWKYQPTKLNGTPVAVEMKVTVTFKMAG